MKKTNIIYWIATGLFAAFMLTSAIPNIISAKDWVVIFEQLGYPLYLLPFLGWAKLLGAVALLVPGFNRLKEWAYAGFVFDLVGAVYSALAAFGFDPQMLVMLVPFVLLTLSYLYHHKKLKAAASV